MPIFDFTCGSCGKLWEQYIGHYNDHPTCCDQPASKIWTGKAPGVVDDSIPGGMVLENLGHEPVTVYSHSEHRRLLKERGLINRVQHTPVPGTDKSPHTTNWNVGGDQTFLDNAKALLEHTKSVPGKEVLAQEGMDITTRTRAKDEDWPERWDSDYRGGPGRVVRGPA